MITDIRELTQRFLDGQTTLDEERQMAEFFRTNVVADEFKPIQEMFAYFDRGMQEPVTAKPRKRVWWPWAVAAAFIPMTLLLWKGKDVKAPNSAKNEQASIVQTMQADAEQPTQQAQKAIAQTAITANSATHSKPNIAHPMPPDDKDDYELIELVLTPWALSEPATVSKETGQPSAEDILNAVDAETELSENEVMIITDAEADVLQPATTRVGWLQEKYRDGHKYAQVDEFGPFFDPLQQRYIGDEVLQFQRVWHSRLEQLEYFGLVAEDEHGLYVPWIREVAFNRRRDGVEHEWIARWIEDYRELAKVADDAVVQTDCDSEEEEECTRLAFAFNGKIDTEYGERDVFAVHHDDNAQFIWWGVIELNDWEFKVHLYTQDKLYASECPEILTQSFPVEGFVYMEDGEPAFTTMIQIEGTHLGTIADRKGHFAMRLPHRDTRLNIISIGYGVQTILPKAKMRIVLKPNT